MNENRGTTVGKIGCLMAALFILCGLSEVRGQQRSLLDTLHYGVEWQATRSGGAHTPLWLNANKYGLSSLETANGYVRGRLERRLPADDGRRWGVGYGLDAALAAGFTSTLVVQQAYVEGRWLKGTLTLGAKEQPVELKNQELSSGAQTLGVNARPVPQVRVALPHYWTVPGLHGWLALKGHIAYGMTTDDRWQRDFTAPRSHYTQDALYHSKAGYLRIGPAGLTLELGVEMACQFGGESYREMARDDWRTVPNNQGLSAFKDALLAGGGDVGEGIYENAGGNQLGSWVARLNYEAASWAAGIYVDHFFEDHSSMFMIDYDGYGEGREWNTRRHSRYLLYDFKDMMLGLELTLKRSRWLNSIVVEYLHTKYQSGPVYHDRTEPISDHVGGNDNYYNHYIFTGWQHWGQVMGNPLYRSPLYNTDGTIRVADNRFVAWHAGLGGSPLPQLRYRLLATYQTGLGTYDTPFTTPRYNLSLLAELSWRLHGGWCLRGALGMDRGALLGDNRGVQLTVVKSGILAK